MVGGGGELFYSVFNIMSDLNGSPKEQTNHMSGSLNILNLIKASVGKLPVSRGVGTCIGPSYNTMHDTQLLLEASLFVHQHNATLYSAFLYVSKLY